MFWHLQFTLVNFNKLITTGVIFNFAMNSLLEHFPVDTKSMLVLNLFRVA